MHPELFEIPLIHVTVKSYGLMMVVGFLSAVLIIRYLSRNITPNPNLITNAALYSLIAGVIGARLFYVVHHFDQFRGRLFSVFAIWQGGLELLGGVVLAIFVIILFLWYHKLPVRRYLDILAIGLMSALIFGRIGCLLNGCCFGKPSNLPWAIRFPYGAPAYRSQVKSDLRRDRQNPQMELPQDFFEYYYENGVPVQILKPYGDLTEEQKKMLEENNRYRSLPVHPTQPYSSANALLCCLILYFFWRRSRNADKSQNPGKLLIRPGGTFALMFILYGITRFFIEFLRDDNPFEYGWWIVYKGATVSQNLSIYLVVLGVVLMAVFQKMQAGSLAVKRKK
ncbi:MAG: prolipoprotein diacylglyceryl transferase [Planctomycetota bacterium]|jgi:phosphatidylglycerol:prolipoprotein diacylglycerol transferase